MYTIETKNQLSFDRAEQSQITHDISKREVLSYFLLVPHICTNGVGHHWVMACRLFGAKQLPEPMLAYCPLNPWKHISVKFE